jgi:site-specific recombinase XerC
VCHFIKVNALWQMLTCLSSGSAWESNLTKTGLLPPNGFEEVILSKELIRLFITSRRQGLSKHTLAYYKGYLKCAQSVVNIGVDGWQVKNFIDALPCSHGGKYGYFRALRTFYRWLYSPRSGFNLNPQDNPILIFDPPKLEKKILPSLTVEQVNILIDQVECVRDKAIISLFADNGLRLSELGSIKLENIDWSRRLIKVWCKGS